MKDAINPDHYKSKSKETIDVVRWVLGDKGFLAFCEGNALKYRLRAGMKDAALQDLEKASWYEQMREHVLDPSKPDPRAKREADKREDLGPGWVAWDGSGLRPEHVDPYACVLVLYDDGITLRENAQWVLWEEAEAYKVVNEGKGT